MLQDWPVAAASAGRKRCTLGDVLKQAWREVIVASADLGLGHMGQLVRG